MIYKRIVDMVARRNYKKYYYSGKTNEVFCSDKFGIIGNKPRTVVFRYYNTFRDVIYLAWIDDIKPKDDISQLIVHLGKTNPKYIVQEMERIENLKDDYEKMNLIIKMVGSSK